MEAVWEWFRVLYETTGIKLTIFYDAFDRARFFYAFLTSLRLMALCLVCSVLIGIAGAWLQGARSKLVRWSTQAYIQFIRNTPPLVQLYFFYFALGAYLRHTNAVGLEVPFVSNFAWAVICLSFTRAPSTWRSSVPASRPCRERRSRRRRRSATAG
jgi:polar amino acid transport system permease protein